MRRFTVICKIEMLLFLRDFFGCFFTLVFPLLMLFLFGGIYGNEPLFPGSTTGAMDSSVPAYCVMVMGVTGLMAFPLTLAACKEKKIYKRYDATPVGKKIILAAQAAVNLLMTLIGIGLLLFAGKLIYHVKISGGAFSICTAILISAASMFSLGFLFTAVAKDAKTANLLCYLFYFVMLFLSGVTVPDMLFPDNMKKIAKIFPMTHAVDLMQGVFGGDSLKAQGQELLILSALIVVCFTAGAFFYRKRDWT